MPTSNEIPSLIPSNGRQNQKAGRQNIFFVPISDLAIIHYDDKELAQYAVEHGFNPLFIHQNFDSETIPDWSNNLQAIILFHEFSLHLYVRISGDLTHPEAQEVDRQKAVHKLVHKLSTGIGKVSNDDDADTCYEVYHGLLMMDVNAFESAVTKALSLPVHGTLEQCHRIEDPKGGSKVIEIYSQTFGDSHSLLEPCKIPTMTKDNLWGESFQGFHRRFEYLMHFFIESCSAIQYDPCWKIYTAFMCDLNEMDPLYRDELLARIEDEPRPTESRARRTLRRTNQTGKCETLAPNTGRRVVGFVSMFQYLGLVDSRRRISQFFILPIYQGKGLASILLRYLYTSVQEDSSVAEMSVEDPALAFKQIRDVVGLEVTIAKGFIPSHCLYPSEPPPGGVSQMDSEDSPLWNPSAPGVRELPPPDPRYLKYKDLSIPTPSSNPPNTVKSIFGNVDLTSNSLLASGSTNTGGSLFGQKTPTSLTRSLQSLHYLTDHLKNVYDAARYFLKESEGQCGRLSEIILLGKYLPVEAFLEFSNSQKACLTSPPAKRRKKEVTVPSNVPSAFPESKSNMAIVDHEGARSYRVCQFVTEDMAKKWANDPLIEPVRLFVKMRIMNEMDLNPGVGRQLTTDELMNMTNDAVSSLDSRDRHYINGEWVRVLYCYMRTLLKLRKQFDSQVKDK